MVSYAGPVIEGALALLPTAYSGPVPDGALALFPAGFAGPVVDESLLIFPSAYAGPVTDEFLVIAPPVVQPTIRPDARRSQIPYRNRRFTHLGKISDQAL